MMLPKQPAIVGAVSDADTLSSLPRLREPIASCDYLEFRVDALLDDEDLLQKRLAEAPRPVLITVRDPLEGGLGSLPAQERSRRMRQFLPHASMLDIEIRNLARPEFKTVIADAHAQGTTILGSCHDFEGTPSRDDLLAAIERGRQAGAGLIKIAVTLRHSGDLHTLFQVFEAQSPLAPMAVMGMGPLGMGSRVLFAQAGSLLTYTYLKNANASGQWSARTMRQLFDTLGIPKGSPSVS